MAISPNGGRSGPQLTWLNVIALLTLLGMVAAGGWALFQSQFTNLEQQVHSADAANAVSIKELRADLDHLRDNSVLRAEHVEFVKRLDNDLTALQRRLDVIETTRPTTGELQSRSETLKIQIDELKDRLRLLEQVGR